MKNRLKQGIVLAILQYICLNITIYNLNSRIIYNIVSQRTRNVKIVFDKSTNLLQISSNKLQVIRLLPSVRILLGFYILVVHKYNVIVIFLALGIRFLYFKF